MVERLASEAPDRFALESVGADGETFDTQTFSALAINVQKAAETFLGLGIGKGDHVFIMLPRCPEWYFAMLPAMRIGAVPMPAPNMLPAKGIAHRIAKAEPGIGSESCGERSGQSVWIPVVAEE